MKEPDIFGIIQSLDAFFPTGAFTQSFGIEDYVLTDKITSPEALEDFLKSYISLLPYQDLGLCSLAYDSYDNIEEIISLDAIGYSIKDAFEIREASTKMNKRFLKLHEEMDDIDYFTSKYISKINQGKAYGLHPISLGILGATKNFPKEKLLTLYIYNCCSSIVNNTVKLVPLSQMVGQKILYKSRTLMEKAVYKALNVSINEIGISGCAYTIHCMNHEKLYSRQYMS